jgi:hypothetical protein
MKTEKNIKKFDRHPFEVEKQELTNIVKFIIEQRDLLEQVECKNLEEFELKLNETTSFKNANLSALAMGKENELARLHKIEKILSTGDLKDEDLDTDGNFTKIFLEALNQKHTIYYTEDEMLLNNKLDSIIKSYNELDDEDRKKLLVNRSNEMQINPFVR